MADNLKRKVKALQAEKGMSYQAALRQVLDLHEKAYPRSPKAVEAMTYEDLQQQEAARQRLRDLAELSETLRKEPKR